MDTTFVSVYSYTPWHQQVTKHQNTARGSEFILLVTHCTNACTCFYIHLEEEEPIVRLWSEQNESTPCVCHQRKGNVRSGESGLCHDIVSSLAWRNLLATFHSCARQGTLIATTRSPLASHSPSHTYPLPRHTKALWSQAQRCEPRQQLQAVVVVVSEASIASVALGRGWTGHWLLLVDSREQLYKCDYVCSVVALTYSDTGQWRQVTLVYVRPGNNLRELLT